MEKTDSAVKTWLEANMCECYQKEFTADEQNIISHTLVYSEQFEEYIYLRFKTGAIVISLDHEKSDEKILKHYAQTGIREYRKYVSKANFPGYELPLRVTRVAFTSINDAKSAVPMPEGVQEELIKEAETHDEIFTKMVESENGTVVYFAWKNVPKRFFLYRLAVTIRHHNMKMGACRFAYVDPLTTKCILVGSVELLGEEAKKPEEIKRFMREFEMLKTFRGFDALSDLVENKTISSNQANLLRALTSLIEQILTDVNPSMYNEDSIMEAFCFHPELTQDFIKVFKAKFHPRIHNIEEYKKLKAALEDKLAKLDTGRKKHDDRRRAVFVQALNLTEHILRTNVYAYHKLGVGFRINPAYLDHIPGFDRQKKFPELPYGLFFVRGGTYMGMQIRFRDLARGGMRTVRTNDMEHERYERANMFTECYNLAYTQQKKNKDIPEGGSKSICFLNANVELPKEMEIARKEMLAAGKPKEEVDKAIAKLQSDMTLEYMYQNQRMFLTTFLTLIVWDFEKNQLKYNDGVVDYLGVPEYIYLGPDENFHDCLADWLSKKSTEMGNFVKGAFISGKEETGINHKEYGVTSWGALQYLKQAVKYVNMREDFTVKMSGGPDGDVAGNFMKLLHKYFPKSHLLAVTDGSGTCYDPEGFDYDELEVLFKNVKMMHEYPFEKLHEGGWILCIRKTRQVSPFVKEILRVSKKDGKVVEEWISSNLAFHLYGTNVHQTKADVFLPCGGRPRTLTMANIQDFMIDGKPSSTVMVEGANLYITADARDYLEDHGVLLFRDSSANKCGVISSSYEILGGLSMTDEQFISVKHELALNIMNRLEYLANAEALCMLDYYNKQGHKVRMSEVSELVSKKINQFTDDIRDYLMPMDLLAPENKKLLDIFVNYIPECIRTKFLDQAMKGVPDMHKKSIIATTIACDLVYGKGLSWWPSVPDVLPVILKDMH